MSDEFPKSNDKWEKVVKPKDNPECTNPRTGKPKLLKTEEEMTAKLWKPPPVSRFYRVVDWVIHWIVYPILYIPYLLFFPLFYLMCRLQAKPCPHCGEKWYTEIVGEWDGEDWHCRTCKKYWNVPYKK